MISRPAQTFSILLQSEWWRRSYRIVPAGGSSSRNFFGMRERRFLGRYYVIPTFYGRVLVSTLEFNAALHTENARDLVKSWAKNRPQRNQCC